MRDPGTQLIQQRDSYLIALDTDVHMQAKDQNSTYNILKLFFQLGIAFIRSRRLVQPGRGGTGTRPYERQPPFLQQPPPHAVQVLYFPAGPAKFSAYKFGNFYSPP